MCIYNTLTRCESREQAEALYFGYLDKHDQLIRCAFTDYGKVLAECLGVSHDELSKLIEVHDQSKRTDQIEIEGYLANFYPYEGDGMSLEEYGIRHAKYEKGLLNHYHSNPHHPEYWIFFKTNERKLDCKPMEPIYVCEMLINWIAEESSDNLTVDDYWKQNRGSKFLHIETVELVDRGIDCILKMRSNFAG